MKGKLFRGYLLLVILIGCSGSQSGTNELKVKISTHQINSWVNLMPGSKPSFFIIGSIQIKNNEKYAIDSILLLKCDVFQENRLIYQLHPGFIKSYNISSQLKPGEEGIYTINLSPGTPVNKELNLDKSVSINFYLSALGKVIMYKIDSIHVMKTY